MPMRLITTSLPRKRSLSCASAYTSQFSSVSPGSTKQMLVLLPVPRQHRDSMAVFDQSGDQPGSQESGAAENGDGLRARHQRI